MYWISIFAVDFLYYVLYSICIILCLIWFTGNDYNEWDWTLIFLFMILFSVAGICAIYVATFYFNSKQVAYFVIFTILIISVLLPGIMYQWKTSIIKNLSEQISLQNRKKANHIEIEYIIFRTSKIFLQLIPSVAFNQGLHDLFLALTVLSNCKFNEMAPSERCDRLYDRMYDCCALQCTLSQYQDFECPDSLSATALLNFGVLEALLFLILDIGIIIVILYMYEARILYKESYGKYGSVVMPVDHDVLKERNMVDELYDNNLSRASTSQDYKLLVSRIFKR